MVPEGRADRPWPPPGRPWTMRQTWRDLLFAHRPVPSAAIRPLVPPSLEVETFDGSAWVGVVPFRMTGIRMRRVPPVPGLASFEEMNLRTYVRAGDRPGVWFFSLDAASRVAVRVARRWFHLPYFDAAMECRGEEGGGVRYRSRRTHRGAPPAAFRARYGPSGEPFAALPGSLEHFLTARYCLYAADRGGRLFRAEVDHPPWPLQAAWMEVEEDTVAAAAGLPWTGTPLRLHFARSLEVVVWSPETLSLP